MAVKKDDNTGKWMYYGSYVDHNNKRVQYKKEDLPPKGQRSMQN